MNRIILTLAASTLFVGVVLADPCKFTCKPAVVGTPHKPHVVKPVVFAEAAFPIFNHARYDVFVFSGPPPAALPGLALGILADGREVRGVPLTESRAALKAVVDAQQAHAESPLAGYEGDAPAKAARPSDDALASSLRASCAQCHTSGSAKGGFVLFDRSGGLASGVDWAAVAEATRTDGRTPPRMPPASSGKAPLSAAARQQAAARAAR